MRSYNPGGACATPGLSFVPVRSPLLGESRLISLPRGTEMFQFPRLPPPRLWIQRGVPKCWFGGFTHSETHGSQDMCSSLWLIAAYHVLRRLLVPRHPPSALTIFFHMVRTYISDCVRYRLDAIFLKKIYRSHYAALKVHPGPSPQSRTLCRQRPGGEGTSVCAREKKQQSRKGVSLERR